MILVGLAAEVDQVSPHLNGRFGDLGQVGVLEPARSAQGLLHFGVQQGVAAAPVELGQEACAIQRDPSRAAKLEK